MRRDELARMGVQLPVFPVIVLGALPGPPSWALRLERIGLDVVSSGAGVDTAETWRASRDAVPHRPVKAVPGDVVSLSAAGCVIVEGHDHPGVYGIGADDRLITPITASPQVEEPDDIAGSIVTALRDTEPASVWIATPRGLDALSEATVEAKLTALVEGTRRARLYLAKHQFEL